MCAPDVVHGYVGVGDQPNGQTTLALGQMPPTPPLVGAKGLYLLLRLPVPRAPLNTRGLHCFETPFGRNGHCTGTKSSSGLEPRKDPMDTELDLRGSTNLGAPWVSVDKALDARGSTPLEPTTPTPHRSST